MEIIVFEEILNYRWFCCWLKLLLKNLTIKFLSCKIICLSGIDSIQPSLHTFFTNGFLSLWNYRHEFSEYSKFVSLFPKREFFFSFQGNWISDEIGFSWYFFSLEDWNSIISMIFWYMRQHQSKTMNEEIWSFLCSENVNVLLFVENLLAKQARIIIFCGFVLEHAKNLVYYFWFFHTIDKWANFDISSNN
jgi:hypothetical protein